MPFIDVDVSDAQEPETVPPGEYKLRILKAELKPTKSGENRMLQVDYEVVDEPLAKIVTDRMLLPDGKSEKNDNFRKLRLKKFSAAFNIDLATTEDNQMAGEEGWAILNVEDNKMYGMQNNVRTYIEPK